MHLQLITLQGIRLDQEIYELMAPTESGEIAVFPGHEHLVTLAVPGALTVRYEKADRDDQLDYFAISGGVVEISPHEIRVLVDEADHGDDIVEAESRAALERAIRLRDEAPDQVEREKAHQLVDRHQVRLRVAELQRRRRR
ncbi:ATP synthase F1 subunit epsilon [Candidatus Saccharibacteria bacterium]|nr:ATP synthase F1 subunit epsilon [Candidatus Saccharibacteria bacterium]MBJ58837.1 ATP synthase F1 subunit epsilon [Candidatus Saccharibacteria bacterium]|tara:strand:+ start:3091 stop:3513 length:423 start_codon:yes stop_codon:yes gene_type:complete